MKLKQHFLFLLTIVTISSYVHTMCPPNELELGCCTQREKIRFEQFWATEQQSRREKQSESFMFTRPIYRNIAIQQSLWHDFVYNKKCPLGGAFQVVGMYQKSLENDSVDRYFLFNDSTTLIVKGDNAPAIPPRNRDIRAEWIGLPADFIGTFSINPQQRQAAVWLEYNQDLYPFCRYDFLKPFWVSIAAPVQFVENDISISQMTAQNPNPNPEPQPQDIIEALNQPNWNYGKFGGQEKEVALAEVFLKLGARFLNRNGFQIGMYNFVNFPLHNAQNAEYIFSPFIGHNRHFGYGNGLTFQLPINCSNDFMFAFVFNIENIRFFSNKQHRSIDLKEKPWSRYLLLNNKDGRKNVPGINVLTQKVSVNPFNMVDLEGAFRFQTANIEAEVGYCLWAHGDERVKLTEPWKEEWGIAGDGALVPGTTIGATASKSTICNQACNDVAIDPVTCRPTIPINPVTCADVQNPTQLYTFVPIKEQDLDFLAASARAALVNRVHAAFGVFTNKKAAFAGFIGAGGYAEIPKNNTALFNWGVWGKFGGRF